MIENERTVKQAQAQKYQNEWQELRYELSERESKLKDKRIWEKSIVEKKAEIETLTAEMKVHSFPF